MQVTDAMIDAALAAAPGVTRDMAKAMLDAAHTSVWVDAQQRWIDELEEGDNIELVVSASVSTDGHFMAPKTLFWRATGSNRFDVAENG